MAGNKGKLTCTLAVLSMLTATPVSAQQLVDWDELEPYEQHEAVLLKHEADLQRQQDLIRQEYNELNRHAAAINQQLMVLARQQEDLDTHYEALKSHRDALSNQQSVLGQHRNAIVSNTYALYDTQAYMAQSHRYLTHRIDDLKDYMKRSTTMSAATANLVPPLRREGWNLSAGAASYGDASAVAVGAGYRFSDHAAIRASVSAAQGSHTPVLGVGVSLQE